jgi:hypothetical protein
MMRNNRLGVYVLFAICVSILVIFAVNNHQNKIGNLEISNEYYSDILRRVKNQQGSEAGRQFILKVKDAYSNNEISVDEYRFIVGMKPDFSVIENPAKADRYARERAELKQILTTVE